MSDTGRTWAVSIPSQIPQSNCEANVKRVKPDEFVTRSANKGVKFSLSRVENIHRWCHYCIIQTLRVATAPPFPSEIAEAEPNSHRVQERANV
jgi:hypothetical protein